MLIVINSSVANKLMGSGLTNSEIAGLEQLANAFRLGRHVLWADRSVLQVLRRYGGLSESARAVFSSIDERYSFMGGVIEKFNVLFEVYCDVQGVSIEEVDGVSRIKASLEFVSDRSISSRTKVVLEYIDDVKIYAAIAKWFQRRNDLLGFELAYEVVNGGGATTAPVFYAEVGRRESLCICIVDSDVKYPGCSRGATSLALEAGGGALTPMAFYQIIDAHEIENLIPIEVLRDIAAGDSGCAEVLSHLDAMRAQGKPNCNLHLDVKKGLSHGAAASNPDLMGYWSVSGGSSACYKACSAAKDCHCFVVPPWPRKSELKNWRNSLIEMPDTSDRALADIWNLSGRLVFNWCASLAPISV